MNKIRTAITLLLLGTLPLICSSSVNRSIRIDRAEKVEHSLKSVNGSIYVADEAEILGDCRTVNGSITLGDRVRVEGDCQTVNGSVLIGRGCQIDEIRTTNGRIELDENSVVSGNVHTTNGRLSLKEGCVVKGSLKTTNGNISLMGVEVKEDLYMSNGEIRIEQKSRIGGSLVINPSRSSGSSFFGLFRSSRNRQKAIEITIRDHSIVRGDIIVRNDNRPVIVYIDSSSEVQGKIVNAEKRRL